MKTPEIPSPSMPKVFGLMMGALALAAVPLQAAVIEIVNPGLESPAISDVVNNSFDGVHGPVSTGVPGWWSNESSFGGAIRVDERYSGRTGNNVLYLHGSATQNFHTAGFDLGVELQSYTTYTLTFDVVRWDGITVDNYVIFRAGAYTGADYESRSALVELAGEFYLLDDALQPVASKTVSLTFTTEDVLPGTKFWIGGDAYGNNADTHRAHYDEFRLSAEAIPEPSSVLLVGMVGMGSLVFLRRVKGRAGA